MWQDLQALFWVIVLNIFKAESEVGSGNGETKKKKVVEGVLSILTTDPGINIKNKFVVAFISGILPILVEWAFTVINRDFFRGSEQK